jgi:hypothetical protein
MQFLYSLFLAACGIAMIVWSKTLAILMYEHTQRRLMKETFTGSWKISGGPIGRVFNSIGKWYDRSLIPANIAGLIFAGIVLILGPITQKP